MDDFNEKECASCHGFFGPKDDVYFPGMCYDCWDTNDIEQVEKRARAAKKRKRKEAEEAWEKYQNRTIEMRMSVEDALTRLRNCQLTDHRTEESN